MAGFLNDRVRPGVGSPRGAFVGRVVENRKLCTDHYCLVIGAEGFPASVPGQFVQIDCRGEDAEEGVRSFEWGVGGERVVPGDADFLEGLAYLRRPFSIAEHRVVGEGRAEIEVIHRVVGKGTRYLEGLKVGDEVSLLGPMGCGFVVPGDLEVACLVGGGVGIPPMIYLAKFLRERGVGEAVGFVGAQRGDLLPVSFVDERSSAEGEALLNVGEFCRHGYGAVITTDDGSRGMKGFVTGALEGFLKRRRDKGKSLSGVVVYCCGPTAMMRATARVAEGFGVRCQLSLEQPMACGMATCQSCVIKYRAHDAEAGTEWKYKLTCTEGPVFDSRDIVWGSDSV